jgi:hypothetical protein
MPSTGLGLGYLSWKERGLQGTKAGSEKRAACSIHVSGEDAPAQIKFQDLAEISRSSTSLYRIVVDLHAFISFYKQLNSGHESVIDKYGGYSMRSVFRLVTCCSHKTWIQRDVMLRLG